MKSIFKTNKRIARVIITQRMSMRSQLLTAMLEKLKILPYSDFSLTQKMLNGGWCFSFEFFGFVFFHANFECIFSSPIIFLLLFYRIISFAHLLFSRRILFKYIYDERHMENVCYFCILDLYSFILILLFDYFLVFYCVAIQRYFGNFSVFGLQIFD